MPVLTTAPAAMATTYTVSTNPYTATVTLLASEPWDAHELSAANGQNVAYSLSVTTSGGCASLLFVKGHGADLNSQYYVTYSQETCVTSYSNSFPVASADGTQFSVLIATEQSQDINYTVTVNVTTPAIPSWALGLLVVVGLVVIGVVIRTLIRRRRKAAAPMPPATPPYPGTGAPGTPPTGPEQWPPRQPPQGGTPPP